MRYKLKENAADFEMVDGQFAGRKYKAGEIYDEIPPGEKDRFEKVVDPAPAATTARAATGDKPATPDKTDGGKDK